MPEDSVEADRPWLMPALLLGLGVLLLVGGIITEPLTSSAWAEHWGGLSPCSG